MKHKYLREIFTDGWLPYPYSERRYKSFDARNTCNFDMTFAAWLYEHLRYFQDVVAETVDMEYNKFCIDDQELTHRQCIDRMVDDCAVILRADEFREREQRDAAKNDLFKVLSACYWAMWW